MSKKPSDSRSIGVAASKSVRRCPAAIPIVARFPWPSLWLGLVMLVPVLAIAQDAQPATGLTEEEAVRRALSRSANADVIEGTVGIARSEAIREGLWPDPEIIYNREETLGAQGVAQDVLMLSQRFDISGRRSLRSSAAEHRARAASRRGSADRVQIAAEVQLRFHELLVGQLRVSAISSWVGRIEAALGIVTRREAAGDASAYDRRRLERELANARARLAVRQAGIAVAWGRLAALIGESNPSASNPPRLSGELLPDAPQALVDLLSRSETHPDILALDALVEAARTDGEAASRWWVPQIALGAGWTGIDIAGGGRTNGYVAMATVSVPIFDRNQDEVLRVTSEVRLRRGQRELALTKAQGEIRGRVFELSQLIEAARRFRREAVGGTDALIRTVEAGYAGGELRILELLDANRGATDDEMTALDLELSARRAHIALNSLTGDGAQ